MDEPNNQTTVAEHSGFHQRSFDGKGKKKKLKQKQIAFVKYNLVKLPT